MDPISAHSSLASNEPALSLTERCQRGSPEYIIAALQIGLRPDAQTLTVAFRRTKEAFANCNYDPGNCANDSVASTFYAWEGVLKKLLEMGARGSDEAMEYAHLIGRGWPEKLQSAQSQPSATSCIIS